MRNKLYFVAPITAQAAITTACAVSRREWHTHTIPPDHANMLVVVMGPTADMETEFTAQYLAFPELHDPSEYITQPLIDAFPASVGLALNDSTFSALKKIHLNLGMAAMHPKA